MITPNTGAANMQCSASTPILFVVPIWYYPSSYPFGLALFANGTMYALQQYGFTSNFSFNKVLLQSNDLPSL